MTNFPRRWLWLDDKPSDRLYVVDTSSWIALYRNYPKKLYKRTWDGVDALFRRGLITSPTSVYGEISARQDELLSWVEDRRDIFVKPHSRMLELVVQINAAHPLLTNYTVDVHGADPCVIALAVVRRQDGLSPPPVVVTEESSRPDKIGKIPYVAEKYDIPCISMADMLNQEVIGG